ncbi:MAG: VCBS repeat-containing protein [Planctomycetota bacterium]|nr:MAG: VCBS repeat-containing protein [Planctomycetota bacterium]
MWEELIAALPDDPAVRINRAVTILKWIDETNNALSSGQIEDADREQQLRRELEAAYALASETVRSLAEVQVDDYRAVLLRAELLSAQARRSELQEALGLRRQAVKLMADALTTDPAQPILAAAFDELVQEFLADEPALGHIQANALYASYQQQPRNLFLLSRACDVLLRNQDPRLSELLDATLELTLPMRGDVANYLRRMDPSEVVANAKQAIASGDWAAARMVIRWINLFKGMAGFKADRRLVKPDLMALLDVQFLDRWASALPSPAAAADDVPAYQIQQFDFPAGVVAWYDYDLDLDFDLFAVQGDQLVWVENQSGELAEPRRIDLPISGAGMRVVDLYPVDDPTRARVDAVADLMADGPPEGLAEATEAAQGAVAQSAATEPTAADVARARRHDTPQDLLIFGPDGVCLVRPVVSDRSRVEGLEVVAESGLESLASVVDVVPLDIESDGDLDLVVSTPAGVRVWQNNGDRTFTDTTQFSLYLEPVPLLHLSAGDWDGDLDQDVVGVDQQGGRLILLENILHGQLRWVDLAQRGWPVVDGLRCAALADLDSNGGWDIVQVGQQEGVVACAHLSQPGQWQPLRRVALPVAGERLEVGDINNDGHLDLMVASAEAIQVIAGDGEWLQSAQPRLLEPTAGAVGFAVIDANGDGGLDLAWHTLQATRVGLAQVDADRGFLLARIRGIADDNGGGRINHYAIGSLLELRSGAWSGRRIVREPMSHFGLGPLEPDNLRIVFPNGLTQDVLHPGRNALVEEKQELKGSCPFVYGWDGSEFRLITDLLWNAPLGLQIAPGEVLPDRRWEYLLLPGELVQPREGAYELRITEELWEVAYFDHVRLTAIDHPADTEVFTNEKVGPPDIAAPRLFAARQKRPVARAVDPWGRDWTEALTAADGRYAQPFRRLVCQGLAEPHFIELDFGRLPVDEDLQLVLHGWMHPTDTSLNIALSQNSHLGLPEPPSLWVVDRDGAWVCAQPFMGFPGGKPKSIVVDLQGVFRSDDHRVRIAGSQQIYWDRAFVTWATAPTTVRIADLALETARLRYRGFGRLLPRDADQPHWYDYSDVQLASKWPPIEGPFTRFGDVRDLLIDDDDRMVVMTSGDEIVLRFALPEVPLPNGWKRDFVLHSVGWDKDADLNTLAGQSALPLPFRAQRAYPPPPDQDTEAQRVWELNRATLTRQRQMPSIWFRQVEMASETRATLPVAVGGAN